MATAAFVSLRPLRHAAGMAQESTWLDDYWSGCRHCPGRDYHATTWCVRDRSSKEPTNNVVISGLPSRHIACAMALIMDRQYDFAQLYIDAHRAAEVPQAR